MRLVGDTNIDFLGKRFVAIALSLIVIGSGIAIILLRGGLRLGIDFTGGTSVQVVFRDEPNLAELRQKLRDGEVAGAEIQSFKDRRHVLIKLAESELGDDLSNIEGRRELVSSRLEELLVPDDERRQIESGRRDLNRTEHRDLVRLISTKLAEFEGVLTSDEIAADPSDETEEVASTQESGDEAAEDPLDEPTIDSEETVIADLDARRRIEGRAEAIASQIEDVRKRQGGLLATFNDISQEQDMTPELLSALEQQCFLGSLNFVGVDFVGPQIGKDLRNKATLALIWALAGILVYIYFRFQLRFAVAAVVALSHDVAITVSIFSIFGQEFNLPIIAALLTIIGYSLNDTIVVFDRVRDNLKLLRRKSMYHILNKSINQMLSRTILTSTTTLMVVLCLFFFGPEVIKEFSFALMVGVIVGTYSSIFVASPVVLAWQNFADKRRKARR